MKKRRLLISALIAVAISACNSVQKSVDPTGQGPLPRGSERGVDRDTIRPPGSDTSRMAVPDSVKRAD
ncbi:hypothetical protein [Arcticibacter sp. MXS-1]|uniref:hypothetical protein n=1 Tax=Arcticibacter sp. MXS-1 TaxID=3341726 RepID=UPI0035A96986